MQQFGGFAAREYVSGRVPCEVAARSGPHVRGDDRLGCDHQLRPRHTLGYSRGISHLVFLIR